MMSSWGFRKYLTCEVEEEEKTGVLLPSAKNEGCLVMKSNEVNEDRGVATLLVLEGADQHIPFSA